MRIVNLIFYPLLLASLAFPLLLPGQQQHSKEEAARQSREAIHRLRNGTLIVRLPSQRAKIEALQDIIQNTPADNPRRKRLEKLLEQTLADKREFGENMMKAFQEAYDFSEVRFMYDTATSSLGSGKRDVFLDENLEVHPGLSLDETPYFILGFGSTSTANERSDGVEAMIIMDEDLEPLQSPFPYYGRLNDFGAFIGSIFPAPGQKEKDALRIVGKLNDKLVGFYNKVQRE